MTTSIIVADDQAIIRAGIVMLLRAQEDFEVVGEASDGREAVDAARSLRADVVVMDVRMPGVDGITATRLLAEDGNDTDHLTRVLILTTFDDDEAVYGALIAGASGFLLKQAAPRDLVTAVRRVATGDYWLDLAITGTVIAGLRKLPRPAQDSPQLLQRLTPREREVLVLMAHGLSNS